MAQIFNSIEDAFQPMAESVEQDYVEFMTSKFEKLMELAETTDGFELRKQVMGRAALSTPVGRVYMMVRRYVKGLNPGETVELSKDFLAKEAKQYGQDQVAGYVSKMEGKLTDRATDVRLHYYGGGELTILASIDGHDVKIDQQRIMKVSSKGTLFHQWPARIYVDGKFTTEKKFKEMLAG